MELSSRGLEMNQYSSFLKEESDIIDCHNIQAIVKNQYNYWIAITQKYLNDKCPLFCIYSKYVG
jgi:hypothetical protein